VHELIRNHLKIYILMKKEYTAPEMSVVEFKSEGVIAASVSSDKVGVFDVATDADAEW
jgi:hypothetical protein